MKSYLKILYGIAIVSCVAGVLAMFAGKTASMGGGIFLFRAETHWFSDSITAYLLSVNLLLFTIVLRMKST